MSFKPVVIHRFDEKINREIYSMRERLEKAAKLLNTLRSALERWYKEEPSFAALMAFLEADSPKDALLVPYVKAAKIGGVNIKPENIESILEIPDYDHILEVHEKLNSYGLEPAWQKWFDTNTKKFAAPELTVEEKNYIVNRHTIWAESEVDLRAFNELKKIKEAQNYFADRGISFLDAPRMTRDLRKYFLFESRPATFTRLRSLTPFMEFNWDSFSNPGFLPSEHLRHPL